MRDLFPKLSLSEITSVERGKFSARPRNDPQYYGGNIPFLQTGDIARAGHQITKWEQTLNERGLAVSRLFPAGTILMSIAANVGDVAISTFAAACPDSVVAVLPKTNIDKEWLFQTLKMSKPNLASLATQNAQANLSLEKITPFKVHVPSPPERSKIGEILRTWDEAVDKANLLVGLREKQYLGLRDQLIDWRSSNQAALGTFLRPVSRPLSKPTKEYRALGIRSHGKGTFARVVEKPDNVDMETLYVAKTNDIIVNITFAWEGAIGLVPPEHDSGLVSHRFPTFVAIPGKANERYLRQSLRMPRFTYLLGIVSPGGAGRNRVLSKSAFLDLEAPLPSPCAQARIAAILDDAEAAIATAAKYRDELDQQKRGMMQKLLTGEWRVKVDSEKEAAA